jgi:flagellar biosynthesis chaperone FliJ
MAVSRALRHLLRVRDMEEDQCRLALESALGELRNLERALKATAERDRDGRRLVVASAESGELPDRLAGLEETRAAARHAEALTPRIADAEADVAALRQDYLAKRIERRQVETLIREGEAQDAVADRRRGQRALDDSYLNRLHGTRAQPEPQGTGHFRGGRAEKRFRGR